MKINIKVTKAALEPESYEIINEKISSLAKILIILSALMWKLVSIHAIIIRVISTRPWSI
ncbi:MAG: hypothetical protein A3B89_00680 [Candidatus Buchananbacteria bacterium RIFCSPHIGHO2_02_FULL_40_13]|uniref:Uncharacterized protein n=1 Tax=Candidatus Buchananbacteria bacterium RIFCSPLOWO2_01_FULL_39_33 TaxID=1797543 RepID=A0A1G1YGP0_9BACT|nr:MAG: hypothetical protein A2820_00740 [Candidatus Buchananbacteria bacterium RIFCSPHIGHO2_01_FULL_40_35]OGY50390.1 MAG: hypothetical protein A3B89_00680 [Candidatus Buchananbacteria bacterium RIFCSPHIGHO2_02_FULL_40_13]OGY51528.1 MAG: hypothetical protein A3A02_01835 [Candidatus Buchananbacteria bacterium RIFCSPLOWO2_01_FULL_39_33]